MHSAWATLNLKVEVRARRIFPAYIARIIIHTWRLVAGGINNCHRLPQLFDPLSFLLSSPPRYSIPNAYRLQVFIRLLLAHAALFIAFLSSVIFFLPLVAAVSNLAISQNPTSGGACTITWTADATDPATISFELVNTAFHNTFAIANNIAVNTQTLTVTLPAVPVTYGILLCCSKH
jgi:hypothetical protein